MSLLQSQIKIAKEQRKLMSFVEYGSDTNFFCCCWIFSLD